MTSRILWRHVDDTGDRKKDVLGKAYAAGYRLSCHANSDKAIAMYLDIMEKLQKKYRREEGPVTGTFTAPSSHRPLAKIKAQDTADHLRAVPILHSDKLLVPFGPERLEDGSRPPFLDEGIKVAAHGADHPCAYPPLMAIHAMVNRTTKAGKPIGQSQRVTIMEALRLYTINSAYQKFR